MKNYNITIDGIQIEIIESEGDGNPIFLFHGNSGSAESFSGFLKSDFGKANRLIAVSFPNHGGSDVQNNDNQGTSILEMGEFTLKVINYFAPKKYILAGLSLGGHALLEVLPKHVNACGLILMSSPPISLDTLSQAFLEDPTGGLLFSDDMSEVEKKHFCASFLYEPSDEKISEIMYSLERTRGQFRSNLGASLAKGLLEDEVENYLNSNIPIILIGGKQDKFIDVEYYKLLPKGKAWSNRTYMFDNCGHAILLESLENVVSILTEYIQSTELINWN